MWWEGNCLPACLGDNPDSELPVDVGNASVHVDRCGKSYLTLSSRCGSNTGRHKGTGRASVTAALLTSRSPDSTASRHRVPRPARPPPPRNGQATAPRGSQDPRGCILQAAGTP